MNIAIIPARGGSKRIPKKNIREFCGKPIMAWPIETAQKSGLFDRIIVSTDDEKIARVARQYGADVPFMRPRELADDYTATRPVINHAIHEVERLYGRPSHVCCIYPAAVFVKASELKQALELLMSNVCQFVFSAAGFSYPIQRAFRLNRDGRPEMFQPEHRYSRSQDLEQAFHDAGQFYFGKTRAFLDNIPGCSMHSIPMILPRYRVHDIDTEEDWKTAELMFKALALEKCAPTTPCSSPQA
jgi:pseudaminic acid cytidylyltransferase